MDKIVSRPSTPEYREGWENAFVREPEPDEPIEATIHDHTETMRRNRKESE